MTYSLDGRRVAWLLALSLVTITVVWGEYVTAKTENPDTPGLVGMNVKATIARR